MAEQQYDPFGKAGAGAPLRDFNGNVVSRRDPGFDQRNNNPYQQAQPNPYQQPQ